VTLCCLKKPNSWNVGGLLADVLKPDKLFRRRRSACCFELYKTRRRPCAFFKQPNSWNVGGLLSDVLKLDEILKRRRSSCCFELYNIRRWHCAVLNNQTLELLVVFSLMFYNLTNSLNVGGHLAASNSIKIRRRHCACLKHPNSWFVEGLLTDVLKPDKLFKCRRFACCFELYRTRRRHCACFKQPNSWDVGGLLTDVLKLDELVKRQRSACCFELYKTRRRHCAVSKDLTLEKLEVFSLMF
jgi:hypothetical protein